MTIFGQKLDGLPESARAAGEGVDVLALGEALRTGLRRPVVAVGSGGSAIAAQYLALCRQTLQAEVTIVQTPLQFLIDDHALAASEVWLFSAGGANPDILAALDAALTRGALRIHLVTTGLDSPLATRCEKIASARVHGTPTSGARDGFLATHSLISAITALLLAADHSCPSPRRAILETEWLSAVEARLGAGPRAQMRARWTSLRPTDTLFVLQDPRLDAAGLLIETCAWEAGLCAVQRTDFRNFAHGRHVWLAHRGPAAFILALTGRETRAIWDDMRGVLPNNVRQEQLDAGGCGRFETACAVLDGLVVVEALGAAVGIDPGRPGAGEFAEALYESPSLGSASAAFGPAVRLKSAAMRLGDQPERRDVDVEGAWAAFRADLALTGFRGLVVDYDGTLVTVENREAPVDPALVAEIVRLLDEGLALAVATGRGGSGGEALRSVLPARFWDDILIAYYNGAHSQPLRVDISQNRPTSDPRLDPARAWLLAREAGGEEVKYRDSHVQLTIDIASLADADLFERRFEAEANSDGGLRLARSSHTLDVCLADACKTTAAVALADRTGSSLDAILCLGDSGALAGNDYALLGLPRGISVGRVCDRPDRAWNLFGGRVQGPEAVLRILRALQPVDGTHRLGMDVPGVLDLDA